MVVFAKGSPSSLVSRKVVHRVEPKRINIRLAYNLVDGVTYGFLPIVSHLNVCGN
tara:strand:+ start:329 stop:493 length:165 start_codon:yes stop_codon:yes gene_type:complete